MIAKPNAEIFSNKISVNLSRRASLIRQGQSETVACYYDCGGVIADKAIEENLITGSE
jgi:hypothetical protein